MSRVVLVHWNPQEARLRAARLRAAGRRVQVIGDPKIDCLRAIRARPPQAFVIDLSRLPSHGRAVGVWVRQRRATRHIPLIFVGGEPEKVAAARALLPDAIYTGWAGIRGALRRALRKPPARPAVPATMAGYSGTPLPKKLAIRPGAVVALLGAPAGFERTLGALPDGVHLQNHLRGRPELALLFSKSRAELERRFPATAQTLGEGAKLWLIWPKKTSGVRTDLDGNVVRAFGLSRGWVDYKICAVDKTWSGLLFARRK
jgi:CheY-like chemotaxis protein